jgi:hypothetical protein
VFTDQEPFEIDDEAVYEEWLWLSWTRPRVHYLGMNLDPHPGCASCARGQCSQKVTQAPDFEAYRHNYAERYAS